MLKLINFPNNYIKSMFKIYTVNAYFNLIQSGEFTMPWKMQ